MYSLWKCQARFWPSSSHHSWVCCVTLRNGGYMKIFYSGGLGLVCHFWIRNYPKCSDLRTKLLWMVCLRAGLSWLVWARLSGKLSWASWGFCRFSGAAVPHTSLILLGKAGGPGQARLGKGNIRRASPTVQEHCKFLPTSYQPNQVTCRNQKSGQKAHCAAGPKQVTWPSLTLVEQGDVLLSKRRVGRWCVL